MAKKFFAPELLTQAQSVRSAWAQIDSELVFGQLTHASMGYEIEQARLLDEELDRLETALLNKRNQRDQHYATVWENIKRVRSAVRGIYGDDSSEYEMVGGTRLSERKSPARRTTTSS